MPVRRFRTGQASDRTARLHNLNCGGGTLRQRAGRPGGSTAQIDVRVATAGDSGNPQQDAVAPVVPTEPQHVSAWEHTLHTGTVGHSDIPLNGKGSGNSNGVPQLQAVVAQTEAGTTPGPGNGHGGSNGNGASKVDPATHGVGSPAEADDDDGGSGSDSDDGRTATGAPKSIMEIALSIARFSLPLGTQNILGYSLNALSESLVGRLGAASLSASTLANSTYSLVGLSVVWGGAAGMETLCGQVRQNATRPKEEHADDALACEAWHGLTSAVGTRYAGVRRRQPPADASGAAARGAGVLANLRAGGGAVEQRGAAAAGAGPVAGVGGGKHGIPAGGRGGAAGSTCDEGPSVTVAEHWPQEAPAAKCCLA